MSTRIHMIFILVVVGIVMYFYFVYREIRGFDRTISVLKAEVNSIKQQLTHTQQMSCAKQQQAMSQQAPCSHDTVPMMVESHLEEESDDIDSTMTTDEIKALLTNIVDYDHQEHRDNESDMSKTIDSNVQEQMHTHDGEGEPVKTSSEELYNLDSKDLLKLKNEQLRQYLVDRGLDGKGTKQELISKIKQLQPAL